MNKIYTKVWNQSIHQFIVASELARSSQRLISKPINVKQIFITLSLLTTAMIPLMSAHGQTALSGTGSNSNNAQADGQCFIDYVDRNNPGNRPSSDGKMVRNACATAVGDQTYAAVGGVAIGYQANSTSGGVAVGSGAKSQNVTSVAISVSALAAGNTTIAVGRQSAAVGDYSIALGNVSYAEGTSSIALGHSAHATGYRSVAIGSGDSNNAASAAGSSGSSYLQSSQADAAGDLSVAIGGGSKASKDNAVAIGTGAHANNQNDTAIGTQSETSGLSSGPFALYGGKAAGKANADNGSVAIGAADNERQLQHVAPGSITETSTDAINGSQLYTVASGTNALGQSMANNLGGGSTYDPGTGQVSSPSLTIDNTNGTTSTYNNVADAFKAIHNQGIKYFHSNSTADDSQARGTDSVAIGPKAVANNANDIAIGTASQSSKPSTGLTALYGGQAAGIANAENGSISVGAPNKERQIENVAAGTISANSTDAINGSQLYSVSAGSDSLGNSTATNLGGGSSYDSGSGKVSAPSYKTYNPNGTTSSANNVGDALSAINTKGIKYFHSNSTDDDSQASGKNSVAIGPKAQALHPYDIALGSGSITEEAVATKQIVLRGQTHTFAGANPTSTVSVGAENNERTVTHVAAGRLNSESTDAVNGSQLYATNQAIEATSQNTAQLNQNAVQYDRNPDGSTNYESVTFNPKGSATQLHNVAAGAVSKNSSDGVNGAQLYAVENKISNSMQTHAGELNNIASGKTGMLRVNNSLGKAEPMASGKNTTALGAGAVANSSDGTALGNGAESKHSNSVALGKDSATDRVNSVSLGTASNRRQLTNLAAGTLPTDGANVGQVQEAKDWSKNYTDSRVNALGQDVNKFNHRANAGIASAIAAASLPQAYQPDQRTIAVGLGNFHGEAGIAFGVSNVSTSGHYIFKLNASTNSRGDAGIGVGAGLSW